MDSKVKELQEQSLQLKSEIKSELDKSTNSTLENSQKLENSIQQIQSSLSNSIKTLESRIQGNHPLSFIVLNLDSTHASQLLQEENSKKIQLETKETVKELETKLSQEMKKMVVSSEFQELKLQFENSTLER